jgi:hippurate hydrolase
VALFGLATEALPELSELARPLLISDDFAWYQRKTPGVFLLLGTGTGIPLHSDEFRFDESVLSAGLSAYQRLVCLP